MDDINKQLIKLISVLPDNKEIDFIAIEESQQDWNDIRHQKVFVDAFIQGAKYMKEQICLLSKSKIL